MKVKRPNLKNTLKKIDNLSTKYFGEIDIDIKTLPCITKGKKEKITANLDSDLLSEIKTVAEKYDVSYTNLMNDVLRRVFIEDRKKAS